MSYAIETFLVVYKDDAEVVWELRPDGVYTTNNSGITKPHVNPEAQTAPEAFFRMMKQHFKKQAYRGTEIW